MKEVADSLADLTLGAPQVYLNLALYPLVGRREAPSSYMLLGDALERDFARVTEVSTAGSVPELAFENASAEKILLVDGDELVGAKQNRVVNLSILVGAGMRVVIPVTCVEQGRWKYRTDAFSASNSTLFSKARASKMEQVSASMRESGMRRSDQGAIWSAVAEKADTLGLQSETMAMHDLFEARTRDLKRYAESFRVEPRQRGAVVALDGKVIGLEIFDSSAAFSRYFEKFVRSYAMDAIETASGKHLAAPEADVRRFLDLLGRTEVARFPALGEGEDIRLSDAGIEGGGLVAGGGLVHLACFAAGRPN